MIPVSTLSPFRVRVRSGAAIRGKKLTPVFYFWGTTTGFMNTAVVQSRITYIDGERGILRYRGYPIEVLAEKRYAPESHRDRSGS